MSSMRRVKKGAQMLRTIQIGSCMSVQGLLVRRLEDGRVVIRVDDKFYTGLPVERVTLSHAA